MAKDDEKKPTAADKGKGKAPVNGDADKDAKNGKDGKVDGEDKKGAVATAAGMFGRRDSCDHMQSCGTLTEAAEELSEEDQQLKSELDMLVERILVSIAGERRRVSQSVR
jgi:26S proteasome regulatory subunit N1